VSAVAERARSLLRWLQRTAPATSALALLPDTVDYDVLAAVSSALDDFLPWPARRPELRARLARLLTRPSRDVTGAQAAHGGAGAAQPRR